MTTTTKGVYLDADMLRAMLHQLDGDDGGNPYGAVLIATEAALEIGWLISGADNTPTVVETPDGEPDGYSTYITEGGPGKRLKAAGVPAALAKAADALFAERLAANAGAGVPRAHPDAMSSEHAGQVELEARAFITALNEWAK